MLTREEQRRADLQAAADERYRRLVRLLTADAAAAASDAIGEQLERARLTREAAARRARLAAAPPRGQRTAPAGAPRREYRSATPGAGGWVKTRYAGRDCEENAALGLRRFLDDQTTMNTGARS